MCTSESSVCVTESTIRPSTDRLGYLREIRLLKYVTLDNISYYVRFDHLIPMCHEKVENH